MHRPSPPSPSETATQPSGNIMQKPGTLSTASPAHRAVEAAEIGTWEWRLATGEIAWSPQSDTIFGLSPGDFSGTYEGFLSLVHESDRPQLQAAIETAIETRQPYHLDHRIVTPDGIIRWVSCRGRAVLDPDGRVAGMAGTTEDITRRKETELALIDLQATLEHRVRERTAGLERAVRDLQEEIERRQQTEAALKASEQRYHALYEHNPTMYFTLTPDGTVLSVNRFGAEELGYCESELVGQSVFAVFQAADHPTVQEQLRLCSQSPGRTFDWEIQKVRKDGQFLWVKERARAITGPDGSPIILIVCEDITEQRQAQAARTHSEERLRSFLNALDDLAFELDERGVYLNVWTHNDDLLLLPKQEIVGNTLDEIHGPETGHYYRTIIHRVLETGTPESVEYSLQLKDQLRHFSAVLSRIPAGASHSPTVAAIIRETTRQKLAEESARELNLALSNAMPGIARLTTDGHYLTVNSFYASALGYGPDELIGQSWTPTVHPDDLPLVAQAFDQLRAAGKGEFEARGVRKNGSIFFKQVMMVRIDNANGEMIGHHCFMRDITDRKQAELALRDSEQAIRALQEATSAPGLTLDQRIHSVLELGCRRFQLPIGLMTKAEGDQLIITHASDPDRRFAPGTHMPLCDTYCSATLTEAQPVAIEHAAQSSWRTHPGYEMLGMESYLGTRLIEEHNVFGTICFLGQPPHATPFTSAEKDFLLLMARWVSGELDRYRSEQALRISEERFEIAFRSSPHPVLITELATGRCIEVNDTALQLFGFQRHEAVGHTTIAIELWPKPEDRTRFVAQLLETGTLRGVEFAFQTKDRRLRYCLVASELIELNGTRCILTVGTDVTEKKEAEAALRESEERWQRFVADAPVGLVVADADKHILSANKAFCALTGYSEQEVINHTYALYTHPDDLHENLVLTDEFFTGQRTGYTYEKRYIRKTGEIIWVSIRASHLTVHGQDAPLLLAVVEDITDRKRASADRERISQDLHDNILQSLYAVGMQLEAGKLLVGKAPRKSKEHVTQAIRQLNHLVLEVRQFITDLTRRTAPTLDFTVALNQLAASCSSETRTAPELIIDPAALTAITPTIGEQLLSIAREALSNSVRHAGATHRSISLTKTDRSIRLRVADDGTGFDPGRKRRRGHGLANMAARARTIGAQFTLDSTPDRGTSVTIDVPRGELHAC
ncbi:MAG: PAS domain S-box protein [Nitrospira sp.]|nr:PAS domain S-box protein [Nitrospira sp.]